MELGAIKDERGTTVLLLGFRVRHHGIIEFLVETGADMSTVDSKGNPGKDQLVVTPSVRFKCHFFGTIQVKTFTSNMLMGQAAATLSGRISVLENTEALSSSLSPPAFVDQGFDWEVLEMTTAHPLYQTTLRVVGLWASLYLAFFCKTFISISVMVKFNANFLFSSSRLSGKQ